MTEALPPIQRNEWHVALTKFHQEHDMPIEGCLVYPYQPIEDKYKETYGDVWWQGGMDSLDPTKEELFIPLIGWHCDTPKPIGLWEKP